jgi:hypothetical protein
MSHTRTNRRQPFPLPSIGPGTLSAFQKLRLATAPEAQTSICLELLSNLKNAGQLDAVVHSYSLNHPYAKAFDSDETAMQKSFSSQNPQDDSSKVKHATNMAQFFCRVLQPRRQGILSPNPSGK